VQRCDKQKSELYFCFQLKKILTKNRGGALPGAFADTARVKLTEAPRSCNVAAQFAFVSIVAFPEMPSNSLRGIKNRRGNAAFFFAVLVALLLSALPARAVDDIPPPFGFHWNDSMTKVEQVLLGAKAKIITKEKKEKRNVWTVEGLIQPGLKRTLFGFKEGFLVDVELQYEYPDWSIERYNDRMGEIRRYFDAKFGTGKLVSRSRDTDSDVIQTLVGYQWIVGGTMLELFYFSAQRDLMIFRSITVTYKAI
jgi:hypothetical protein